MARRRFIDPSFWSDPDIKNCTVEERLLFLGCISHADDKGRLLASPEYLKAMIFPYDSALNARKVARFRDDLVKKMKNLVLYRNDDVEYLAFLKWSQYQKPQYPKPSKLPPPPPDLSESEQTPDSSSKLQEALQESLEEPLLEPLQDTIQEELTESLHVKVGRGGEGLGRVRLDTPLRGADVPSAFGEWEKKLNSQPDRSKKIGMLVETFRELHSEAPPEDFEKAGARLGLMSKGGNEGYILKLLWQSASEDIKGSHLDYIQRMRSKFRARDSPSKLPTSEELDRGWP